MKKSLILLPLVTAMTLTACSSDSGSAEVTEVGSGSAVTTAMPSWQSNETIQSTSMPASMSSAPSQTITQAQTTYNNAQMQVQSTYNNAQTQVQSTYNNAQTKVQSTYNNAQMSYQSAQNQVQSTSHYSGQAESVGNCQIVRDGTGMPVYTQMTKGCYTDATYTVGKSDTIYLISFLTGKTPAQIASLNNISTSTKLSVGQVLRVQ